MRFVLPRLCVNVPSYKVIVFAQGQITRDMVTVQYYASVSVGDIHSQTELFDTREAALERGIKLATTMR